MGPFQPFSILESWGSEFKIRGARVSLAMLGSYTHTQKKQTKNAKEGKKRKENLLLFLFYLVAL